MKTMQSVAAALVFFLPPFACAEEQVIPAPGEGWRIRFDAPKLSPTSGATPSVFFGRADRFQLSFFVQPPRCNWPDTDENIYACFLKLLLGNPYVVSNTVRGNTRPNGVLVMYLMRAERDERVGSAFNMNLLFARNGKWADVHASFTSPTQEDVKALFAIMDSIKVEDIPVPDPLTTKQHGPTQ